MTLSTMNPYIVAYGLSRDVASGQFHSRINRPMNYILIEESQERKPGQPRPHLPVHVGIALLCDEGSERPDFSIWEFSPFFLSYFELFIAAPCFCLFQKKGAARGLCGTEPSSALQQVLIADCLGIEYHERGGCPCESRWILLGYMLHRS